AQELALRFQGHSGVQRKRYPRREPLEELVRHGERIEILPDRIDQVIEGVEGSLKDGKKTIEEKPALLVFLKDGRQIAQIALAGEQHFDRVNPWCNCAA